MGAKKAKARRADAAGGVVVSRSELPPYAVYEVALTVRQLLLWEFPDRHRLELQCKRAGVLLAELLGERGMRAMVVSGRVARSGWDGEPEHVWCVVAEPESGEPFLLDVSLTQFQSDAQEPVPEVVWGRYEEMLGRYGYVEDDFPLWDYDPVDFDPSRIRAARRALRGIERRAA